jgi:E3 ubiquitin-protein ligase SHPRH
MLRNPPVFQSLFQRIALRHTKSIVREELQLPPQKRYVITMPFTPVEEQHYQSLFQKMCDECGVDLQGGPLTDDWDPTRIRTIERMRAWLSRLRQSALHPEIGVKNRRALGRKDGPLRTIEEVLETMLEQTELSVRGDQRTLHLTRLKRGQTLENSPRVKEALEIWKSVLEDANAAVSVCREQLQHEIDSPKGNKALGGGPLLNDDEVSSGDNSDTDDLEDGAESALRIGALRNRLNAALEIQHIAVFFCANAYFQIKSNEEMTKPDSEEFMELEKLEAEGYQQAKMIRQEILKEIFRKNTKPMERLAKKASSEDFLSIPEFHIKTQKGGIESIRLLEQLDGLAAALDAQANQLDEWRETTIQNLLQPLVDEEGAIEMTGEEYLQSTELQQEIVMYVLALRAVIEDRHDALTGQENQLVKHEVKAAIKQAKDDIEQAEAEEAEAIVDQAEAEQAKAVVDQAETDAEADIEMAEAGKWSLPRRTLELLQARAELKPPKAMGSVKGILSELKTLSSQLRMDVGKGSSRAANELAIVERNMAIVRPHLEKQLKAVTALRQEIDGFTSLMNLRVEYYRQLQQISDMVLPLGEDSPPDLSITLLETEQKLGAKIATNSSKLRYLVHLKEESTTDAEARECLICTSPFENGLLTVCGHIFCKECMGLWFRQHKNCPACKRLLTVNDLHDITYKPRELKMAEEAPITPHNQDRALVSPSKKSGIYSQISKDTLAQIKNIDLVGPSFTTKVDTLCRHLLWLREADPFAKSIIFSQFSDFLVILGRAFAHHRIGYSTIDKPGGIEKFKNDPSTECFLLHAKSQSSGLNLVNASHVFLCEPLINTALELQAIARVDRIGQQQATTVWLYLVDGTVEEAIYDISVRRRMEHMGGASTAPSKESTPELADRKIEVANSLELQQAPLANLLAKGKESGEFVGSVCLGIGRGLWKVLLLLKRGWIVRLRGTLGRRLRRPGLLMENDDWHYEVDLIGMCIADCL